MFGFVFVLKGAIRLGDLVPARNFQKSKSAEYEKNFTTFALSNVLSRYVQTFSCVVLLKSPSGRGARRVLPALRGVVESCT